MHNRRNFLAATGSVGVAIAALGWTGPAWTPLCPSCKTTSLKSSQRYASAGRLMFGLENDWVWLSF